MISYLHHSSTPANSIPEQKVLSDLKEEDVTNLDSPAEEEVDSNNEWLETDALPANVTYKQKSPPFKKLKRLVQKRKKLKEVKVVKKKRDYTNTLWAAALYCARWTVTVGVSTYLSYTLLNPTPVPTDNLIHSAISMISAYFSFPCTVDSNL